MGNFCVPVTLDTKAHLKRFPHYYTVHLSDVAVAFPAIYARLYVRLMAEISKLLKNVYALPFDGNFIRIVLPELYDLGVMNNYFTMA